MPFRSEHRSGDDKAVTVPSVTQSCNETLSLVRAPEERGTVVIGTVHFVSEGHVGEICYVNIEITATPHK